LGECPEHAEERCKVAEMLRRLLSNACLSAMLRCYYFVDLAQYLKRSKINIFFRVRFFKSFF